MKTAQRQAIIRRVTWVGAAIDSVLALVKLVAGWLVHSPALIADGLHSLSDLVTDIAVVFFSRLAQAAPDADHPYGHYRYETLGTVILGASLLAVAAVIAWDSLLSLIYDTHTPQASLWAIAVATISIGAKEWIFRYTLHHAKRVNSQLLEANAWHSRSDALSSIIVLVGVIATWLGYAWVELLAAMAVALLIGKMGIKLTWNATQDLVDRGIEPAETQEIKETIRQTPGVVDVHQLRSRMMGNHVYLDVHIQVDAFISVSEGHYIAHAVVAAVQTAHNSVTDITVHVDHEDDLEEEGVTAIPLPTRAEIEHQLAAKGVQPSQLQIHYVGQRIALELFFESKPDNVSEIQERLTGWSQATPWLASYKMYIAIS